MPGTCPSHRRLLVVDPSAAVQQRIRLALASAAGQRPAEKRPASVPSSEATAFCLDAAPTGPEAVRLMLEADYHQHPYSLALVDESPPGEWDGVETVKYLWDVDPFLEIVIFTSSGESPRNILHRLGRSDRLLMVKKPLDPDDIRLAVLALTEKWRLRKQAETKRDELQHLMRARAIELVATQDITVFALAKLAESRDPETGEHLERMRSYAQVLGEQLADEGPYASQIDQKFLEDLYRSTPLHDIGKVGIPDSVLLKPGRLTPREFEVMKQHVRIGADALRTAVNHSFGGDFLKMAVDIAEFHHERYDGSGYLQGLRGTDIPLAARIVSLADVFDALTSNRVYKEAMPAAKARQMIEGERGKHFDPAVVDAFRLRYDDLLQVGGLARDRGSRADKREGKLLPDPAMTPMRP